EESDLEADSQRLLDAQPFQEDLHRIAQAGGEGCVRADAVVALQPQQVIANVARVRRVHLPQVGDVDLRRVDGNVRRADGEQALPSKHQVRPGELAGPVGIRFAQR